MNQGQNTGSIQKRCKKVPKVAISQTFIKKVATSGKKCLKKGHVIFLMWEICKSFNRGNFVQTLAGEYKERAGFIISLEEKPTMMCVQLRKQVASLHSDHVLFSLSIPELGLY